MKLFLNVLSTKSARVNVMINDQDFDSLWCLTSLSTIFQLYRGGIDIYTNGICMPPRYKCVDFDTKKIIIIK